MAVKAEKIKASSSKLWHKKGAKDLIITDTFPNRAFDLSQFGPVQLSNKTHPPRQTVNCKANIAKQTLHMGFDLIGTFGFTSGFFCKSKPRGGGGGTPSAEVNFCWGGGNIKASESQSTQTCLWRWRWRRNVAYRAVWFW